MSLIPRLILRTFIPVLLFSITFFVLLIQMVDLFANLVRFLNLEVPVEQILHVQVLFLPKSVSYALPIGLLFAVAFTLGDLHAHNELLAIFGTGVSLIRASMTLIIAGIVFSVGSFFFEEHVVIPTFIQKNELSRDLLNIQRSFNNPDVTVRSASGRVIYTAEFYNDSTQQLNRVLMLVRDQQGRFLERLDAEWATWENEGWVLHNGVHYLWDESSRSVAQSTFDRYTDERFDAPPRRFQRSTQNIEELSYTDAREWIDELEGAGFPFRKELTDYYGRFSFAMTPFIVVLLSTALAGRFRKNILLMSLLVSLITAVLYYVTDMVAGILATDGIIPPLMGAWIGSVLFMILGAGLFAVARN